jgi:hypothetical protein
MKYMYSHIFDHGYIYGYGSEMDLHMWKIQFKKTKATHLLNLFILTISYNKRDGNVNRKLKSKET